MEEDLGLHPESKSKVWVKVYPGAGSYEFLPDDEGMLVPLAEAGLQAIFFAGP